MLFTNCWFRLNYNKAKMYGNCKFDVIHLNKCMCSICILNIIINQTKTILMWLVLLKFLKAKKQLQF